MMNFLFPAVADLELTPANVIISVGIALVLGLALAVVYIYTNKKRGYISSFPAAMVMLATLMAGVTVIINSNVVTAVSLGGAVALLRIRSYPKDTKDILYLFFEIIVGIGCGTGYYGVTIITTVILGAVTVLLSVTNFGIPKKTNMLLKITVPEDLNFEGTFDDILEEYTDEYTLREIRSTDFGSLYQLRYVINLPESVDRREFIDNIRTRNGNLEVVLTLREFDYIPKQ